MKEPFEDKWSYDRGSLDFGGVRHTDEVILDEQRVGVVLLKDHDQVVQHGDVPKEQSIVRIS